MVSSVSDAMDLRFSLTVALALVACHPRLGSDVAADAEPVGSAGVDSAQSPPGSSRATSMEAPQSAAGQPPEQDRPTQASRVWGRADLDPSNDSLVAPPDAVPDCGQRLMELGVEFRAASLPLKQYQGDIPTCGALDAVTLLKAPGGMSFRPPATVTCQLALALVEVERLIQAAAKEEFGKNVRSLHQGGTYSCRKMARFNLVSEHSYGNAIDIFAFTLDDGSKVSVLNDYGKTSEAPSTSQAKFLRKVASAAFDEGVVSVSLSPFWDALHRDHFHFDMARYRVDGTR